MHTITRTAARRIAVGLALLALTAGCTRLQIHVNVLASDDFQGRNNNTPGSVASQQYLINQLRDMGFEGLDTAATGDDAYRQFFTDGVNIVGVLRGAVHPDEYVMIGGHYDHLGSNCRRATPEDSICNGATDNAAGTAVALEVGHAIASRDTPPDRSVIVALWDREEDGLLGSNHYVQHPLVPNDQVVAYLNFDIQGANLLPSLRTISFAIGAESGGPRLSDAVQDAIGTRLETKLVSSIFGQARSDYVNFTAVGIPNVFFGDSTGPCYHTVEDEPAIVDWKKLDAELDIAVALADDLITGERPTFAAGTPVATYDDAVAIREVLVKGEAELVRFSTEQQAQLQQFRDDLDAIVSAGPGAFDDGDVGPLLSGAATAVSILTTGTCDGFLAP
jgi:hypothetical protein